MMMQAASTPARLAAALLAAALLPAAVPARAQGAPAEPLELRKIMQGMGRGMEEITRAISVEQWDAAARLAQGIAEHPQPPAQERARIIGFFGADAAAFRGRDQDTQNAAVALGKAAASNDGRRVIGAFADLQASCLACHQGFRPRILEHFYGQKR